MRSWGGNSGFLKERKKATQLAIGWRPHKSKTSIGASPTPKRWDKEILYDDVVFFLTVFLSLLLYTRQEQLITSWWPYSTVHKLQVKLFYSLLLEVQLVLSIELCLMEKTWKWYKPHPDGLYEILCHSQITCWMSSTMMITKLYVKSLFNLRLHGLSGSLSENMHMMS